MSAIYLTTAEAARALGISQQQLVRRIKRNRKGLVAKKMGRDWFVLQSSIKRGAK